MATIPEALAMAIQHYQAGRLQAAEQIYRQILAVEPNQPDALHLLGVVATQVGKYEVAIEYIERAIRLQGSSACFHNNLGETYRALRRIPEAVACYRRALALKPDFAEAHYNLGVALIDQSKLDEAIACFRRALELRPDYADAHINLGNALKEQTNLDEAVACYRRAVELKPDYAEAYNNLGVAFKEQGNLGDAVACYRRALQLKPDYAEAHNNLGNAFKEQGNLSEAVACCCRALQLKPGYAEAHNNLGVALKEQGILSEAVACCRRALQLKPDYAGAHSNLLYTLQYRTGVNPAALAEAHAEFDRLHAAPLRGEMAQHENVRARHGPLRLGFVSPDLGRHPVGYFLISVLENLRQLSSPCEVGAGGEGEQFDIICYSDRIGKDDLTGRFQAAATQWRDVLGISDQRLAEQIRADRIDILFDLAGHTAHNRLLVFARKPAPIQITWLGYVGTTGMQAMDYILADRNLVPPEAEPHYCEKVLRMPDGYACYSPPAEVPAPGSLPAVERGYVTFGSFNNLAKITPQVIEIWTGILHRVSRSRLVIRYRGLNDAGTRQRFMGLLADHGIACDRVDLLGWSPSATWMDLYNQIDIGLDPFPYSGATTTCDALWMGVPVITCPGETFASRQSLTHICVVRLTETIARDLDEYVELAVSLAGDLPRLAALRAGLRQRMAASPLCDGKRFADNLASMLRQVWEQRVGYGNNS